MMYGPRPEEHVKPNGKFDLASFDAATRAWANEACACSHPRHEHYPSPEQLAAKPNKSAPVFECHGEECSCSGWHEEDD